MLFNARSLGNKEVGVIEFLKEKMCDVCFVTEAWLKVKDKSTVAKIQDLGYDVKFQPRRGSRRGGGICVLFKPDLNVSKCNIKSYKSMEVMQTTIKSSQSLIRVSTFYRTGNLTVKKRDCFINDLDHYLESLIGLKGENVLCGDFNVHVEHTQSLNTLELYAVTESYGFSQLVNEPTHQEGGILDLIFLKYDGNMKELADKSLYVHELYHSVTSDHCFIEYMLSFVKDPPKPEKQRISFRDYKSIDIRQFCSDFEVLAKSKNIFSLDLNDALHCFNESLVEVLDSHAPIINKQFSNKRTDFTNPTILSLRRLRRKYERKYRRSNNPDDLAQYTFYVNQVRKCVNASRNDFYRSDLSKQKTNKKHKFKTLNSMLGNRTPVVLPDTTCDFDLCNEFAQYFVTKIDTIRENITNQNCTILEREPLFESNQSVNSLDEFSAVTPDTLKTVMSELSNKQCELDVIPTELFKACSQLLSSYVLNIINVSLHTGTFPDKFKRALVRPTFKSSALDNNHKGNFRPLSNLCFYSKVLEKCVFKQLVDHLDANGLLGNCQSAYRQFHSCETALTLVSNDILNSLDSGLPTFIVMLDLSAAFDTVDHSILIERLKTNFHIKGTALQWFKSYLNNRSFNVKIRCSLSNGVITFHGVPQGSILGPILFLLYISEIEKIAKLYGLELHMFADDMQIYIAFKRNTILSSISNIEHCLRHIKLWMSTNFLKVNEDKTQFLLISSKTKHCNMFSDLCLSFGGTTIVPSLTAKNLGVTLDSNMSMISYINMITSKGYFYLHNFYKVADKLTHDLKVELVTTYILPLLDYCNILLFAATKVNRAKLQKLLNNAVRFVFNLNGKRKRKWHITPFLKKLHILPIESRIVYKSCLFVYKCIHGLAPKYLSDLIVPKIMYDRLRSSKDFFCLDYTIPQSKYGESAYSHNAPYHWNKLPFEVKMSPSLDVFKTSLKTYLFTSAYCCDTT